MFKFATATILASSALSVKIGLESESQSDFCMNCWSLDQWEVLIYELAWAQGHTDYFNMLPKGHVFLRPLYQNYLKDYQDTNFTKYNTAEETQAMKDIYNYFDSMVNDYAMTSDTIENVANQYYGMAHSQDVDFWLRYSVNHLINQILG